MEEVAKPKPKPAGRRKRAADDSMDAPEDTKPQPAKKAKVGKAKAKASDPDHLYVMRGRQEMVFECSFGFLR